MFPRNYSSFGRSRKDFLMTTALTTSCKTVGQYVVERPARARVFESFGIDYCCGGKKALDKTCQDKGIDLAAVLAALEAADVQNTPSQDWSKATLTELADHIEQVHHQYLKREF